MVWNEPGKDKDPWKSAERPPDLERMVKSLHKWLSPLFGGKRGGPQHFRAVTLWWLVPLFIVLWLASGFYKVAPGDRAAPFVLGIYLGTTQPGLHWLPPWPVGRVDIIQSVADRNYTHRYNRLVTRDGDIAVVDAVMHYQIVDLRDYLLSVATSAGASDNPEAGTLAFVDALTDAAVSEAVARSTLVNLLGAGQDAVALSAYQRLAAAIKSYDTGIVVTSVTFERVNVPDAVSSANADVVKARQDAKHALAVARTYGEGLLPKAQATADAQLTAAADYRSGQISRAKADTARFDAVLMAYRKAPGLTRDEVYLQTMEDILDHATKILVDTRSGNVSIHIAGPYQSGPAPSAAIPSRPQPRNGVMVVRPPGPVRPSSSPPEAPPGAPKRDL